MQLLNAYIIIEGYAAQGGAGNNIFASVLYEKCLLSLVSYLIFVFLIILIVIYTCSTVASRPLLLWGRL